MPYWDHKKAVTQSRGGFCVRGRRGRAVAPGFATGKIPDHRQRKGPFSLPIPVWEWGLATILRIFVTIPLEISSGSVPVKGNSGNVGQTHVYRFIEEKRLKQ